MGRHEYNWGMSKKKHAVHVATIKKRHNGKTCVTHLLRRTFREGGKVKHVTVGNLSDLPGDLATLCKNRVRWKASPDACFDQWTVPTDLQRRAFDLLGLAIGV